MVLGLLNARCLGEPRGVAQSQALGFVTRLYIVLAHQRNIRSALRNCHVCVIRLHGVVGAHTFRNSISDEDALDGMACLVPTRTREITNDSRQIREYCTEL